MENKVAVLWLRRDLRITDSAAMYFALKSGLRVLPIFIFDTNILDHLPDKADKRLSFIHDALTRVKEQLEAMGSTLLAMHGTPQQCFGRLMQQYDVAAVYTNRDYEPYATQRDKEMTDMLAELGVAMYTYKDQVIFEQREVVKDDGKPYTVYTPYSRKWKDKLRPFYLKPYPVERYYDAFVQTAPIPMPTLAEMGFEHVAHSAPPSLLDKELAAKYDKTRDIPSINGTTRLGVHLRFGTISIRQLAAEAKELNPTLLNELIWREFYMAILWHYPHVVGGAFKPEYDKIVWRNNEQEFERWCKGQTGYPIVDAGMRELNETGYMHNRVRMIVASFLTKDLLIDWRWGEAYFASKLLDYDLSANNGGWQWAAGSGCDAAPYFRVFNPTLQTEKFDPKGIYIRRWVPEVNSLNYPKPIVDHSAARDRCLKVYKAALGKE